MVYIVFHVNDLENPLFTSHGQSPLARSFLVCKISLPAWSRFGNIIFFNYLTLNIHNQKLFCFYHKKQAWLFFMTYTYGLVHQRYPCEKVVQKWRHVCTKRTLQTGITHEIMEILTYLFLQIFIIFDDQWFKHKNRGLKKKTVPL